jgi:hypothetical protein
MRNSLFEPIYFAPQRKLGGGWIAFKDSPSPPPQPDYVGAAQVQGDANLKSAQQTAILSNPNINNAYGSQQVSYSTDANGNMIPTVNQTLNPTSQQIFDQQQQNKLGLSGVSQQALGTVQNALSTPFKFGGPDVQTSINNPNVQTGLDTSGVAKMPVNAGVTGQQAIMARLAPALARSRAAMENRDANQGIMRGSEAYNTDQTLQGQQENDATTQAVLQGLGLDMTANNQGFNQAVASGQFNNQAVGQQFNQNLQGAQFGNTAQQQALAQALQLRNQPLNEINALMSSSQVSSPQFQGYTGAGVTAAPYMQGTQAAGNAANNIYNAQMGAQNANTSGLYGLGGAGLMGYAMMAAPAASDRRLKSNIVRIGTHPLGIGIYEYDIAGMRRTGVMADELEPVMPEAVYTMPSGFKVVDYAAL